MPELYHSINSLCAQKVRIALHEKGLTAKDHIMWRRAPTLIHDGAPIVESALVLYYLDDAFPEPPLMPKAPSERHRVRMYNKLIEENVHNCCMIRTFATAFRPAFLKMTREAWQAEIAKSPLKRRAEYKRSVIEHGLDSRCRVVAQSAHGRPRLVQGTFALPDKRTRSPAVADHQPQPIGELKRIAGQKVPQENRNCPVVDQFCSGH